jgi:hypothetical protein
MQNDKLLIYVYNDDIPNQLEFRLIYFNELITLYLAQHNTYYDKELKAVVIKSPNFILSMPGEGTMGITQYIKGFSGREDNEQYFTYILHFPNNFERDRYKKVLNELLDRLTRLSRQQICSDRVNTRIEVKMLS